jgi:hypothetical protein
MSESNASDYLGNVDPSSIPSLPTQGHQLVNKPRAKRFSIRPGQVIEETTGTAITVVSFEKSKVLLQQRPKTPELPAQQKQAQLESAPAPNHADTNLPPSDLAPTPSSNNSPPEHEPTLVESTIEPEPEPEGFANINSTSTLSASPEPGTEVNAAILYSATEWTSCLVVLSVTSTTKFTTHITSSFVDNCCIHLYL